MFDKDLQSRNEVSPGSITASSSVQLYFLSGGICNLNTGLMNPKWYKQYGIKSDDCGHQAVRCLCSGWTGWEGIKSLKPNLSGMTLYKFLIPRPPPSSLSSDVIETQFGHSQCEGFIICEQSNHVRPKDSSRDEPKAQIWRSVIISTNLLSGKISSSPSYSTAGPTNNYFDNFLNISYLGLTREDSLEF